MKQLDEMMRDGRAVFVDVEEFAGKLVEGLRLALEKLQVEHRLGRWQVVLAEVSVEAGLGRAEVGDARADADAGAGHDGDSLESSFFQAGD